MSSPSFELVQQFVAEFTGHPLTRVQAHSTLFGDLGVDGDDGHELLASFGERFNVDMSAFESNKHFGSEGFLPWAPLYWFLLWLRGGTPEQKARLMAITIADLVRVAIEGAWPKNLKAVACEQPDV
jgi:hypothetical protein